MLRWRLPLGAALIAVFLGLGWLDHTAGLPGAWLMPIALIITLLAAGEMIGLMKAAGFSPVAWTVYVGSLLVVLASWAPTLLWRAEGQMPHGWLAAWPALAVAAGAFLVFIAEMRRFDQPGRAIGNLATAVLAIVYVGLMMSFVVRLRLEWGIGSLASLIIVVKMGDTGAYTVGRLIGRHKLAPRLSPGKTVEGALGAALFSVLGAWFSFQWLLPWMSTSQANKNLGWGWIVFGLLVGMAGLLGDLAESLLKRDASQKDSSTWMPGFGGVLDLLDSILLAAPVAYVCWTYGLVGQ